MNAGIDYGLGKANIDKANGIRYGVIAIHNLHECIYDELEADYGEPHCYKCGTELTEEQINDAYRFDCPHCGKEIIIDNCHSDEMVCQYIDTAEYKAIDAFDHTCLFVEKSPYFTFANFCSPCAPGAGDLDSPCENGAKTYCFGHDYFDTEIAPYPVYRVDTGELVKPTVGV